MSERLESKGRRVDYFNTVIMADNALQVFDMAEQIRIDPEKKVDEQLAVLRADIDARRHHIKADTKEEVVIYQGYMKHPYAFWPTNENPLYRVGDDCIGCGTCSRVCPMGCIHIEDKRPVYNYDTCANCYACIQACPKKAIHFIDFDEPNPDVRYRNPHVTLADLMKANAQV